jgi:hypothetical protein
VILTDIRRLLQTASGPTSLSEIAAQVGSDPEAVRAMLEVWIGKGQVLRLPATGGCGSQCQRCDSSQSEYYVWANRASPADGAAPHCPGA